MADAFRGIAGVPLEAVLPDEERFFRILVERIEPGLGYPKPVFLTRWPASMASLARLAPEDPRFADRACVATPRRVLAHLDRRAELRDLRHPPAHRPPQLRRPHGMGNGR